MDMCETTGWSVWQRFWHQPVRADLNGLAVVILGAVVDREQRQNQPLRLARGFFTGAGGAYRWAIHSLRNEKTSGRLFCWKKLAARKACDSVSVGR